MDPRLHHCTPVDVSRTDTNAGQPSVNARPPDGGVEPRLNAQTHAVIRVSEQAGDSVFSIESGSADTSDIGHFVTNAIDVTHATRTEAARRRLNSLLEAQSARIAGALHDEASQFLASAHLAIAAIAQDVPPPVQVRLQEVRLQLDEVAEQLRRVSDELHPSILDDLDPIDAIRSAARTFTRRTRVQLAIEARMDEPCPPAVGAILFRFVQEALTNIGAHARATTASVSIAREGSRLVCAVRDDGVGFDVAATLACCGHRRLGLMLIRDRLEAAGGSLDIASALRKGTRLRAVMPLEIEI
jgi:signal transduction histidine kinase